MVRLIQKLEFFNPMLQQCTACLSTKHISEFYTRDNNTGRKHRSCKECYKTFRQGYAKAHYEKYGDQYRKRAIERKHRVRNELRQKLAEYLADKACEVCGYSDARALEFDHIHKKNKRFGISKGLSDCLPWEIIESEIQKCRVLCANCHKIRTSRQYGWYKDHGS